MAARDGMTAIIAQIRLLIGDPAGDSPTFSDEELQTFADGRRVDVYYGRLRPEPSVAAGGSTSYLTWTTISPAGWFDTDTVVVDGSYNELSPESVDYARGVWTFAETQSAVMVRGARYDVWFAAADAVDAWAAKVKFAFDFAADGATFKRSQMVAGLERLANSLRSSGPTGGVRTAQMIRDDVN